MKISEKYPSKYLKGGDCPQQRLERITSVTEERMTNNQGEDNDEIVVHFQGEKKGLVLNKTNASTIVSFLGDDTDSWVGNQIVLFSMNEMAFGKMSLVVRVRQPMIPTQPMNQVAPQQAQPQGFSAPEAPGQPDNPVGQSFVPSEPAEQDVPF